MRLTRRRFVRSGAAAGVAVVGAETVTGCGGPATVRDPATEPLPAVTTPAGATDEPATAGRVLLRGEPGRGGYRPVVLGPGEGHLVRTDLGVKAQPRRRGRRKALLSFAQLSDIHIVDVQSPLRVEFSDRYEDGDAGTPKPGLFASAYRPHEMLTGHVADAMVRRINQVRRGPVLGKPIAFAVQTGDNSDNSQLNEVRWNIDVLDGGTVRIDSGDHSRFEGVASDDGVYYDPHYWHPEGTPESPFELEDDQARARYGFPTVPGLLAAARRPFRAQGLRMPWYSAFGNHDGLAQGNFPRTADFNAVATGRLKIISPPAGYSQRDLLGVLQSGQAADLLQYLSSDPAVRPVTPDPRRRLISRQEIVAEHFTTRGLPRGHGFTAANRRAGTAYYAFDRGLFRFVVLDTVNVNGMADGSLDATQFAWLQGVLGRSSRRLVVVCSHHTSRSMGNDLVAAGGDAERRVLGPEVVDLLLARPQVIAWINGHTHTNNILPHRRGRAGGFWEINTASHIDWPQQARLLEVADNRDGTLSIFTTMLDHAGPANGRRRIRTPTQLASLSRELAANDWHERDGDRRGDRVDRNLELLVAAPAWLRKR